MAIAAGAALEIADPHGHLSPEASTVLATILGAIAGVLGSVLGIRAGATSSEDDVARRPGALDR